VLPNGDVLVGSLPTHMVHGTPVPHNGSLLILDDNGQQIGRLTSRSLLQGPWDLTINSQGDQAQVFVSDVLSGTVTRIDMAVPPHGPPRVTGETQIASGYTHRPDPAALVVGPTGLVYDPASDILYVASTGDNAVYAVANAGTTQGDRGTGQAVITDAQHLHGPLGMVQDPNGDLIVANGDAVNPDPSQPNELDEFMPQGQFVAQFQVDSGAPGGAFGIGVQQVGQQVHFAAVDDNTNTLHVWTYTQPQAPGQAAAGAAARTGSSPHAPSLTREGMTDLALLLFLESDLGQWAWM
jgi:hypothetical protein